MYESTPGVAAKATLILVDCLLGVLIAAVIGIEAKEKAATTAEEARDIGQLAQEQGWRTVLLVTSAFHLPRSLATFEKRSGLTVIPIACDFLLPERQRFGRPTPGSVVQDLLPDAGALYLSSVALKEHLGLVLYRLKGWA